MALKPCKECGKEISTEAKVCPNCGKKNPTTSAMAPSRGALGCLVLVVFIGIIMAVEKSSTPAPVPETPAARKADSVRRAQEIGRATGIELCEQAARRRLKAPSTAQFLPSDSDYTKETSPGRWEVQVHVDAQNSFGAMMRTVVECKMRAIAGNMVLTGINSWSR